MFAVGPVNRYALGVPCSELNSPVCTTPVWTGSTASGEEGPPVAPTPLLLGLYSQQHFLPSCCCFLLPPAASCHQPTAFSPLLLYSFLPCSLLSSLLAHPHTLPLAAAFHTACSSTSAFFLQPQHSLLYPRPPSGLPARATRSYALPPGFALKGSIPGLYRPIEATATCFLSCSSSRTSPAPTGGSCAALPPSSALHVADAALWVLVAGCPLASCTESLPLCCSFHGFLWGTSLCGHLRQPTPTCCHLPGLLVLFGCDSEACVSSQGIGPGLCYLLSPTLFWASLSSWVRAGLGMHIFLQACAGVPQVCRKMSLLASWP